MEAMGASYQEKGNLCDDRSYVTVILASALQEYFYCINHCKSINTVDSSVPEIKSCYG